MAQVIDSEELFAEEVLMFVLDETLAGQRFLRNLRPLPTNSPFSVPVRFQVRRHLENSEIEIMNIFNNLLENGDLNVHFRIFCVVMRHKLIARGYDERELVLFSTVLCKLAVLCFLNNYRNCLKHAKSAIVDVLRYFKACGTFTRDGWSKLNDAVHFSITHESIAQTCGAK